MKKLTILLITLIVFAFGVSAQSYTQKWNNLYNRTEFFDSNGRMIGYAKYNDLYKRYDVYNSNNTLIGYYKWSDLYNRWEYHQN